MDTDSDVQMASDQEDEDELSRIGKNGFVPQLRNALDALVDEPYEHGETDDDRSSTSDWQHQLSVAGDVSDAYDQVVDSLPQHHLEVRIKPMQRLREYPTLWYDPTVEHILEEFEVDGKSRYIAVKGDGAEEEVTHHELINLPGGLEALQDFQRQAGYELDDESSDASDVIMVNTRPTRTSTKRPGFVPISNVNMSEDEDEITRPTRRNQVKRGSSKRASFEDQMDDSEIYTEVSEDSLRKRRSKKKTSVRKQTSRPLRSTKNTNPSYDDSLPVTPGSEDGMPRRRGRPNAAPKAPLRRSERDKKSNNMREILEDDIPEAATQAGKSTAPKHVGAKEAFKKLPVTDDFRLRHLQICDTCNEASETGGKGFLIYCQGCILAYHSACLGSRNGREHLVTKVGDRNFVLQCRRCVGTARKKDPMAPNHARCAACSSLGASCRPFRPQKTPRDEQREREQNGGEDPVTHVSPALINNAANVLFRCVSCYQAFHMLHLPSKVDEHDIIEKQDDAAKADKRFAEYTTGWLCHDCDTAPDEIGALVAWRPKDVNSYQPGQTVEEVLEDKKEYLIKWQNKSYYRSTWKNGSWVWGRTSVSTRKAFAHKDDQENLPKMRTEDAIPEDYLRVDIVFDVKYNNKVSVEIEEVDRARIKEVKVAMVKYKGLAYEDAVWEEPPPAEDKERYADFKLAYEDWVRGRYMHVVTAGTLVEKFRKTRQLDFEGKILQNDQPKSLKGGVLMQHQQEGLNWLLYKWYSSQNGILADEMGLGKTIQIIAFMATLQEKFNLAPFLIVVPNATCANWRREIKQWCPGLRVATFFGSATARDLAQRYELFPKKDNILRCHVVVTSYDAAQDAHCQRVFNRITWTALVVDEGQRLKNDKNLLYQALSNIKVSFTVLLTGTPVQNNPRELFNLLAFLDKSLDAEKLEEENKELTQDKVEKMHTMLKSFVLRRTKRQTLKDLPAMAQIIVPITMSPLQKKLYKSILGKNAVLLQSIFGGAQAGSIKGLRNILMQLRQCLCHPYVYNQDIEGRAEEASSHRQLVEASAKLQILDIMLPKLRERGHRVLIFSQFLHMLTIVEDFLSGLALEYLRLDGSMGSLEKQKVIDAFNAPNSSIFALLLSTRAGGVGINLASADTVIIMDPDFNPHQDLQAISRAHRLGQQKKVLVFQLMTRMSAEEKIMQIGKKKMALDHVLIDRMDRDEDDGQDLESVLRYGAEALFKDDVTHDIRYDSASVDKLLDRSQVEDTSNGHQDESAESSFSFAKIWQNETLAEGSVIGEDVPVNGNDVWHKIMEERERQADEAKRQAEQLLGRGKRSRKNINYSGQGVTGIEPDNNIMGETEFDPDFQVRASSEEEPEPSGDETGDEALLNLEKRRSVSKAAPAPAQAPPPPPVQPMPGKVFQRAKIRPPPPTKLSSQPRCLACNNRHGAHPIGHCPAKIAGSEFCNLCGQAHFGTHGSCPQLKSEEKIRAALRALENSPEDKVIVDMARRQLKTELAHVVQEKKRKHDATLFNTKPSTMGTQRSTNGVSSLLPNPNKKRATAFASGNYPRQNTNMASGVTQNGLPRAVSYGANGIGTNHQAVTHAPPQHSGPAQGYNGLIRNSPYQDQYPNPPPSSYDAFYTPAHPTPAPPSGP